MLSDYFSQINDHGTVVPVKDLAAFPRSEQAVLGAKNLFSPQFGMTDNAGGTHSEADGVITVNTTTTENSGSYFSRTPIRNYFADKPKQGWILSFDYKSDISCAGYIGLSNVAQMPTEWTHYSKEIPDISQIDFISLYNRDTTKTPVIQAKNFMFSLDGGEYVPFAMPNKELTDAVTPKDVTVTASTGCELRPANQAKICGNILNAYIVVKNTSGSSIASSTTLATISGVNVKHDNNFVKMGIKTGDGSVKPLVFAHSATNKTITISAMGSTASDETFACDFTEIL